MKWFYMALLPPVTVLLLHNDIKSGFWRRGREKLLEICRDTVNAMLKVHLFCTGNVISLLNTRICRFEKRLHKPETCFWRWLGPYINIFWAAASDNPPQQTNPSNAITKEKKCARVELETVGYDTCELQKSDLILNSRNNRRAMNKSIGGRHFVHIYSVISLKCRTALTISLNRRRLILGNNF